MELLPRPLTLKGSAGPAPQAQAASQLSCGLPAPCGAQDLRCQVWAWGFLCHGHFPSQSLSFLIHARGTVPPVRAPARGWEGQVSTFSIFQTSVILVFDDCTRFVSSEPPVFYYVLKTSYFSSLKKKLHVIT